MSDTPRTDAAEYVQIDGVTTGPLGIIDADFARTLERELAAAKEMHIAAVRRLDEVCRDRDAWADGFRKWKAYAERLEKAGDSFAEDPNPFRVDLWAAAKETKP